MKSPKLTLISRMGGKYQLIDSIVPIIMQCAVDYNLTEYSELCGGGARMLLNIPLNVFEHRIYNEINKGICSLFKVLQNKADTAEAMTLLEKYRYSREVFEMACKELELDKVNHHLTTVELAVVAYIASTQSRASNTTSYNPSREFEEKYYEKISRLKDYYYILESIEMKNQDCIVLLEEYKNNQSMLIYIDPPYLPNTLSDVKTYGEDSWDVAKHELLTQQLLKVKAKVILSGYDNETYSVLEDTGWAKIFLKNVHVSSGANGKKKKEYVWCNFEVSSYILQKISSDN